MVNKLRQLVENNCISKESKINSLDYWSDVIFARCVFVLVPLSMVVIIPALIICLQNELYLIFWFNVFCLSLLIFVGYMPGIKVKTRKLLLILLLFFAVFILLKELGDFGPGLAYLVSITVIYLLLFPGKKTFLPFILTLVFCILYGLLIHYDYVELITLRTNQTMEWIAVSSNVVFLSALISIILPFFLSKLEETLEEKNQILDTVNKMNKELEISIKDLRSKNTQLEQYAFVASHDLQEPLRMITSFMEKLKLKYGNQLNDNARQYINYAIDGAHRMRQIIIDFLEYSRAESPAESITEVNLNDVLAEYKQLRRKIISEKSATLLAGELPIIYSYKAVITQILHSLLDNAIKYSQHDVNPKIEISVVEKNKIYLFAVKDNGIGIAPEFFEKIFILFQRLHNKNEFNGTGIGLSIAKKQVEFLGGEIWLESTLGEGSTFYFTIPNKQS